MSFNINEFLTNAGEGFARETHFSVEITLPKILQDLTNKGQDRDISFMCNAAQIPGRRLETVTQSRFGMGLYQPFAVGAVFTPLTLEFYCDAKADTLKLFHSWHDRVFQPMTDSAGNKVNGLKVEFPDNYLTTLSLFQHDVKGDKIAEWKFYDAFPEAITPIQLSWSARNSFIVVQTEFAYAYFEQAQPPQSVTSVAGNPSPAQNNRLPKVAETPINLTPMMPGTSNIV